MTRRLLLGLHITLFFPHPAFCSGQNANFSGTWKQSGERCVPERTANVTRRLDHHGPGLVVETTVLRCSEPMRYAVRPYRIGGDASVLIGADGDEFT